MPGTRRTDLGLGSRRGTYTLVVGVVIGLLAAGLGIPFIFGTPLEGTTGAGAGRDGPAATPLDGTGGAAESPGEVGGAAGGPGADGSRGSSGSGGSGGGRTGSPRSSAPLIGGTGAVGGLTASDRGVTADSITLAFMLVDLGGVGDLGVSVPGFDPESQKRYVNVFIEHTNATGGVLGRKLAAKFFLYDPTDPASGQAACRAATQDNAIFAAVDIGGGLDFPGQLCFTEQNRTPLIVLGGFGTTEEMYAKSQGRLVSLLPSGVRSLANTGHDLVVQGRLRGKRIGILDRDFPGTLKTVTDGMVATLERLGYRVTHRADLSMDDGTAASQVPLAVQQMRANGVDVVMLLTDFIIGTQFVQTADRSGYTPDYVMSDFGAGTNDIAVFAMPPSFRAVGITTMRTGEWRANLPEPGVDAACREVYAAATRTNVSRGQNAYGGALQACGMVGLFTRAAVAAGPELTRARWVAGVEQLGAIAYPNFGGVSFRPGKPDGADPIRTLLFNAACDPPPGEGSGRRPCWLTSGPFKAPHY